MSAPEQIMAAVAAGDARAQAAEWLARQTSEDWNETQQQAFDIWLAASPAHRVAFLRVKAAWSHTYRLAVLRRPMATHRPTRPARRWNGWARLAAAAIVVMGVSGAGVSLYLANTPEQSYSTALGQRKTVRLADGSHVELNTGTLLRARINLFQRKLWLERGEAYFEVAHEAHRPFIVMAGNRKVTDLGTKFTVRRDAQTFKVALLEGAVLYEDGDAPRLAPVLLEPGDEIIATETTLSRTRKTVAELETALGWQRGMLIFSDTTLAEAAAEFNRYNRKKLVIADSSAAQRTIGASFPVHDIELFARMARNVLRLKVEDRGGEIVISK